MVYMWVGWPGCLQDPQTGWIVPPGVCTPYSVPCSWGFPPPCWHSPPPLLESCPRPSPTLRVPRVITGLGPLALLKVVTLVTSYTHVMVTMVTSYTMVTMVTSHYGYHGNRIQCKCLKVSPHWEGVCWCGHESLPVSRHTCM